ncbi:hypothetical protein AQV86_02950 [Nanohaloarchaea archaeon SG9]|nr:hypothetical protein AQV86_02950 [Nanohaloarchaea archaeon SG9]
MNRERIDTERGDNDIIFIKPDIDMEKISDRDNSRKFLKKQMKKEGLEWENSQIIGLFQEDFSLMLDEDGKIFLEGEKVYSNSSNQKA